MRIISELEFFGEAFLWGICLDAAYNILRIFRKFVKHGILLYSIEDLLYCAAAAVLLFGNIFYANDGIIRWYIFLALILGMSIHSVTLGRGVLFVTGKLSEKILHVVKRGGNLFPKRLKKRN